MAADSPTPGTPPPCTACGYQHNPLGWCKANVCADCGLGQHAGPDHYDGCPAAPSPVDTTEPPAETRWDKGSPDEVGPGFVPMRGEPPAETQPDDELFSWLQDGTSVGVEAAPDGGVRIVINNDGEGAVADLAAADTAALAAALAARPSAETETLRRVRGAMDVMAYRAERAGSGAEESALDDALTLLRTALDGPQ